MATETERKFLLWDGIIDKLQSELGPPKRVLFLTLCLNGCEAKSLAHQNFRCSLLHGDLDARL